MASYSSKFPDGDADCSIGEKVRKAEFDYTSENTLLSPYVSFSMYETLNRIDAYINSRHISGDTDAMGREKPFFNICIAARNIWYRATDIDRKNIRYRPKNTKSVLPAFLANIILQNWMREANFGTFLNDWGRTLSTYGSAISKFVEKEGELIPKVQAWSRMIVDAIDFDANLKIEILEMTEAQLRAEPAYDQELVEKLCDALSARKLMNKEQQDTKNNYIRVYEVHGNLPLSYLTNNAEDDDTYVQQMHVLSFVATKEKGKFDDYTLASGREKIEPNYISHLIKEDGRTLAIGSVEHLFEGQWMLNHTVKAIKDQLDLASLIILQTADETLVGQNALESMVTGDIIIHKENKPITQINLASHDISSLQSFGQMWKTLSNEINGISEAMMGANQPSGSAWRQTAALLQESHSLFELMTENKGLAIEEMIRRYVNPFIKKKLKDREEISAILEAHEITKIDAKYVTKKAIEAANSKIVEDVIAGNPVTPEMQDSLINANMQAMQGALSELGNQRFFVPSEMTDKQWSDIVEDFDWDSIEVDITGESSFSKEDMETLTTVLQTIAQNPNVLLDPRAKLVFNKILSITGAVSPLELEQQSAPSPVAAPALAAQPVT